jgi:hypothetical protein
LIHAFIIGTILFAYGYYQNHRFPKWSYYGAFLISALSTMAAGYYFVAILQSGDTLAYFQAALDFNTQHAIGVVHYLQQLLSADIPAHASNWHSVFFVKFISPFVYLSDNNYWLAGLYLTLVNFLTSWLAMRYLISLFERQWLIFISIFLLPSVTIWSGGVFKEAIANGLFLLVVSVSLFRIRQLSYPAAFEWVLLLLGGYILLHIRFYLFGIWVSFGLISLWFEIYSHQKKILWSGLALIIIGSFIGAQLLHPWLRPSRLPLTLFEIYEQVLQTPSPSSFTFKSFQPDYWHLIITGPLALLTGLFRPSVLDLQALIWAPFLIEKLSILTLSVLSLWMVRTKDLSQTFWTAIAFISLLTSALTLVTPNFGSLIRYQSAYLPFLLMIIGWLPLRKLDHMN